MRRLSTLTLIATIAACNSESPTAPDRPITAVTVAPTTSALLIGQSVQLSAAVTGGFSSPTITWATSNANVASVSDSGRVVAKAVGSATVTATAGGTRPGSS